MLTVDEIKKVVNFKQEMGIPINERSCFGVSNPRELRPPFDKWKAQSGENKKIRMDKVKNGEKNDRG